MLHKIKYGFSVQELVIVTTLEAIEDIVKSKWGSAAKRLFDVKRAKIDFLLRERELEGRELAYISNARQTFG
jgi:hypothetical protein